MSEINFKGEGIAMARSEKAGANSKRAQPSQQRNGSRRLFDDIVALAATLARGRQDYGAGKLMTLAASTREFADTLNDMPSLRAQAAAAAESLEGLADYVMHTDIEQMIADAGTFARRHPAATLAMTAAAGIAASRMMRPIASGAARKAAPARNRTAARAAATTAKSRRRATAANGANGQAHATD